MEEKKINKSIVYSIIAVLLLVIIVAGSTYAYFRAAGETDVQTITTADLGIRFVEGELFSPKLVPILREDILSKAAKKTFTVTNTGEEKLFVHISMDEMVLPEELKRYDFMWSLYEGDKNVSNGTFADATTTSVDVAPYQVFEKGEEKTYHLYVWIEETSLDQNVMMSKTFNTKIKAIGETYHTTAESCFTFADGSITGYDETCGTDVIIPETIGGVSVTKIDGAAFSPYPVLSGNLTSVVIPDTVTSIGDDAFRSNQLTNLFIPNSVTTIDYGAFQNNKLTNVSIPNSVTEIGDEAFGSNQLKSVVIPNSVEFIAKLTFISNDLTNVIIPNSVTDIGILVFGNNPNLKSIVIQRPSAEDMWFGDNWYGSCPTENIIYNSSYQ